MARFLADQSVLAIRHESGTYANISGTAGVWPGQVQGHEITENQNVILTRYLGNASRDVAQFNNGPLDVEGTFTFNVQDWRMLGFALGSISTTSGTSQANNYRHSLSAVNSNVRQNAFTSGTHNPFISFALEETRVGPTTNQTFQRTLRGCVANQYTLNVNQGEPVTAELAFLGQVGSWFSGNAVSLTAGSHRPYLWSDTVWQVDGTTQNTVKSLTFTLNNNFEGPHYVNGSRVIGVPYPLNREYTIEVTADIDSDMMGSIYDTYFIGGSLFNALLDINNTTNTGSHRLNLSFSGCRITECTPPAGVEGVNEMTYTLIAGSVSALAFDRSPLYTAF